MRRERGKGAQHQPGGPKILLALGSNDPDADAPINALSLVLGAIQAEAEVFTGDTNLNDDTLDRLAYAHASRLEALKGSIDAGYITTVWPDTVEAPAENDYDRSQAHWRAAFRFGGW